MREAHRGLKASTLRLTRDELFLTLTLTAFANAIAGRMMLALSQLGWAGALMSLFNISVVVWFALFSALALSAPSTTEKFTRQDGLVAVITLSCVIVPLSFSSWIALTGLALYYLRTAQRGAKW